ncbi:MAG: hypothetical protein IPM64_17185 [Phycisphaerales bacterium]|nr:hypothetical protein [Phycisphaerales bacterium]
MPLGPGQRVIPGEPVELLADWFNTVTDVTSATLRLRALGDVGSGDGRAVRAERRVRNDVLRVRNDTGDSIRIGHVLGISDALLPNGSRIGEAPLAGRVPQVVDAGRFVVVTSPAADEMLAEGTADGIVWAKVRINREHHRFAEVENGETVLRSMAHGSAALLWIQAVEDRAEGIAWCIVQLHAGAGPVEYVCTGLGNGLNSVSESSLRGVPATLYGSHDLGDVEDVYCRMYSGDSGDPAEYSLQYHHPRIRVGARFPVVAAEYFGEVRACCPFAFIRAGCA